MPLSDYYYTMIGYIRENITMTRIIITVALRGNHRFLNYKAVLMVLKNIFRLDVIDGTFPLSQSLLNSNNPIFVLRLVDTSNVTQLGKFEDFVTLCSESTILIVDHHSFLKNVILMRDNTLVINLHGDYNDPSVDSFLKLSETFSVFMKTVTVKTYCTTNRSLLF